MANRKLGKSKISEKFFRVFLFPSFQFCTTAKIEISDLKILEKNFRDFRGFDLAAFDRAVLNGNDVLSILVVSTKKRYSSFLKKVFVFQKICFKVKVLKTFETFTDCHIKTCRSLKRRAI